MADKSLKSPWWLLGLNLVFFCLLFSSNISSLLNGHDYFLWAIMGVGMLALVIQFVRQFRLQHVQYSIRSLLVLTAIVAVLCSIYTYLGFMAIIVIAWFASVIGGLYWKSHNGSSIDPSPNLEGIDPSPNLEGRILASRFPERRDRPGNQTPDDQPPTD